MGYVDLSRIAQLLEPYANLDEQRLRLTSIYIDLLIKWNARVNLTAIRGAEEMVTRHFGESFFAAKELITGNRVRSAIDLGSGAGFPGIPLAMHAPEVQVSLIESNQKKATFLREVIFALGLKNANVFCKRGEEFQEQADLVTMRAVESFSSVILTAMRFVRAGGQLGLLVGASQVELARGSSADFQWADAIYVPGGDSRVLLKGTREIKVA